MTAEEILIQKAGQGDLAAYGQLVERYQERVYNLSYKMLGTPEDAKDASQEIFVKVYKALPGFRCEAGFSTWLYRIASNKCLDILRKKCRERDRYYSLEGCGFAPGLADPQAGPEETLLRRERREGLQKAVAELPETYRLALVLHHYQGFSYREVARIMGITEKTVATRLLRAKQMLRKKLVGGEAGELSKGKKKVGVVPGRGMSAF